MKPIVFEIKSSFLNFNRELVYNFLLLLEDHEFVKKKSKANKKKKHIKCRQYIIREWMVRCWSRWRATTFVCWASCRKFRPIICRLTCRRPTAVWSPFVSRVPSETSSPTISKSTEASTRRATCTASATRHSTRACPRNSVCSRYFIYFFLYRYLFD